MLYSVQNVETIKTTNRDRFHGTIIQLSAYPVQFHSYYCHLGILWWWSLGVALNLIDILRRKGKKTLDDFALVVIDREKSIQNSNTLFKPMYIFAKNFFLYFLLVSKPLPAHHHLLTVAFRWVATRYCTRQRHMIP